MNALVALYNKMGVNLPFCIKWASERYGSLSRLYLNSVKTFSSRSYVVHLVLLWLVTKGILCAIVNSDKNIPLLSVSLLSFPPPLCPPSPPSPLSPPGPFLSSLPAHPSHPHPRAPLSAIGLGVTGLFSIAEKQSN